MNDIDPLDPEIARALREAPIPEPPKGAHERVLGRLGVVLPAIASRGAAPAGRGPGAGSAPSGLAAVGSLSAKGVALLTATFLAGGAAGGLTVSTLHTEPPRIVYVDRPVLSPASAASIGLPTPFSAPSEAPAPVPAPSEAPAPVPAPSSAAPRADARASESAVPSPTERLVIDDARRDLADGDARGALRKLDDHARRFPHAELAEEREALAIQALVQLGRFDAAQSRAASFRKRWPESVYRPAVEATLRSIP